MQLRTQSYPLVFLFGAGASYGASHVHPYAPPLGDELYARLAEEFPNSWGPNGALGKRYGDGLEHEIERTMFDEVNYWEPALTVIEWYREMAYYFSKFVPDETGKDCYTRLFSWLDRIGLAAKVAFATINYECILDHVVWRTGRRVASTPSEEGFGAIPILKIHGACNLLSMDLSRQKHLLTNPGSAFECSFEYIDRYSVLSWYSTAKNSPLAPAGIQRIRNWWKELVRQASAIAVIGVRHVPDDRHVIEPIKKSGASHMLYVGGVDDFAEWKTTNARFEHVGEKFEDSLESLSERLKGYLHDKSA